MSASRSVISPRLATRLLVALTTTLSFAACKGSKSEPTEPVPTAITSRASLVPATSGGYVEARTSQIVQDGGPPSQVFDDFTFTALGTIRTVEWQGIYCVQSAGSAAPSPTASSFVVSFYADSSGKPRLLAPLRRAVLTVAEVAQTFEKNQGGLTCGSAANTNWSFYRYKATLPDPLDIPANTKTWVSVQAVTPNYNVYFGWRDGLVDNSQSWQLFSGTYTSFGFDRAFALKP